MKNKSEWYKGDKKNFFDGKKLKETREARGITVEDLATWASITPEKLRDIEALNCGLDDKTADLLVIGVTGKKKA